MEIDYFTKNIHNHSILIKGLCMKTALLLVVALILATNSTYAAPAADSCLKLVYWPETPGNPKPDGWNKDSVKKDRCPGSPTYNKLFAKKYFKLAFPPNFYPFDHILDSNETKSIIEIDSAHLGLLNRFLELQDSVGLIYFQGNQYNSADSIEYLNPTIRMFFAEYKEIDYIMEMFTNTIDSVIYFDFISGIPIPASISDDESLQNSIELYPNPVKNVLLIKNPFTAKDNDRMELFSVDGKRILETAYQEKLDVSMLLSGSYFLRINNQTIKFIKE